MSTTRSKTISHSPHLNRTGWPGFTGDCFRLAARCVEGEVSQAARGRSRSRDGRWAARGKTAILLLQSPDRIAIVAVETGVRRRAAVAVRCEVTIAKTGSDVELLGPADRRAPGESPLAGLPAEPGAQATEPSGSGISDFDDDTVVVERDYGGVPSSSSNQACVRCGSNPRLEYSLRRRSLQAWRSFCSSAHS
jgi:hypothetical protein